MAHGVATVYVPRSPATGVLYAVVRSHLTEFLAAVNAETDGSGLPGFVVNEFRKFLRCGVLSHGSTARKATLLSPCRMILFMRLMLVRTRPAKSLAALLPPHRHGDRHDDRRRAETGLK